MTCRGRHSKERNLLEIDCTGCDASPDLRKHKCLNGALLAFDPTKSIEGVLLSGTVVKMYSAKTVELLSHMRVIMDTLSGVKLELDRNIQAKKEFKQCRKCHFDPRRLLDELLVAFLAGLTEFFTSLRNLLEASVENTRPKCDLCLLRTKGVVLTALDQTMILRRYALKEGLGIVEM